MTMRAKCFIVPSIPATSFTQWPVVLQKHSQSRLGTTEGRVQPCDEEFDVLMPRQCTDSPLLVIPLDRHTLS